MPSEVPDHATHYYLRGRRPFWNLSDLEDVQLERVLLELEEERGRGLQRIFGSKYMALRRLTEARMRELFIAAGGKPERKAPHYFVLGSSRWFRGLYPEPEEVVVELAALPSEVTSVTYPDSFAAMAFGPRFGLKHFSKPYHERVFRLEELEYLIAEYGMPDDSPDIDYEGFQHRPIEKFVEVQLWSDLPVAAHLGRLPQ